jgi:hypothetical protein
MKYEKPEIATYSKEELEALELACGSVCCAGGGSRD